MGDLQNMNKQAQLTCRPRCVIHVSRLHVSQSTGVSRGYFVTGSSDFMRLCYYQYIQDSQQRELPGLSWALSWACRRVAEGPPVHGRGSHLCLELGSTQPKRTKPCELTFNPQGFVLAERWAFTSTMLDFTPGVIARRAGLRPPVLSLSKGSNPPAAWRLLRHKNRAYSETSS